METLALALHFPTVANPLFFFFFWSHCVACRILVPKPGIEPMTLAMKLWRSNHWTSGGSPYKSSFCRVLLPPPFLLLSNGELYASSSLLFLKPDGVWKMKQKGKRGGILCFVESSRGLNLKVTFDRWLSTPQAPPTLRRGGSHWGMAFLGSHPQRALQEPLTLP